MEETSALVAEVVHIWTYPGKEIFGNSIAVMPEMVPGWDYSKAYGYCSDYYGDAPVSIG